MSDSISMQENFIEQEHSIEDIIGELRMKKLKLLQELNVVEQSIKYQTERLKLKK
jgi:hypothetical protein